MSAEARLCLVITPATRAVDAEAAVQAQASHHGFALTGDHPRYVLQVDAQTLAEVRDGRLSAPLGALLTDLAHHPHVRSVGFACQGGEKAPDAARAERLQIGEFLVQARRGGLRSDVWYLLHAPAGFRCRPGTFA